MNDEPETGETTEAAEAEPDGALFEDEQLRESRGEDIPLEEPEPEERAVTEGLSMVDVGEIVKQSEQRMSQQMLEHQKVLKKDLKKQFEEYEQRLRYDKDPRFKGMVRKAMKTFELSVDFMRDARNATDKRSSISELVRSYSSRIKELQGNREAIEKDVLAQYDEMKEAMRDYASSRNFQLLNDWVTLIERKEGLEGLRQEELDLVHQYNALKTVIYHEQVPEIYVVKEEKE